MTLEEEILSKMNLPMDISEYMKSTIVSAYLHGYNDALEEVNETLRSKDEDTD